MNKPYAVYVNGILARKHLTLKFAVKTAEKFMGSFVVDLRSNAVVWKGV